MHGERASGECDENDIKWRRSVVRVDDGAWRNALEMRCRSVQSGANGSSGSDAEYRPSTGGGAYGGDLRRIRVAALRSGGEEGERHVES